MAAPGALALLGSTLKGKDGDVSVSSIVGEGKVVGIYFSAHWCPPCRMFTPALSKFYKTFKSSHARKDDLEMVFVSSDRDESQFNEYYAEMPFLALPYAERDAKTKLSQKFKVQGIPTLVFVDGATGELITGNGREAVSEDPEAANFPWKPKQLSEVLVGDLIDKSGKVHKAEEALAGKIKLLYFSAHWCPPCRGFTPELVKWYEGAKAAGKNMEVVFVSSDRDEGQFKEYLAEMPWLAVPLAERAKKNTLSSMFDVDGIPTLVVLDESGKLITKNGRGAVSLDPTGADFPWYPKPLDLLNPLTAGCINEAPLALIIGGDGMDGDKLKTRAEELLLKTATAHKAGPKADDLNFLYVPQTDDMAGRLADFCHLEIEGKPEQLLLLDIPGQCVYLCEQTGAELTTAVAEQFVAAYLAGSLKGKALR